MKVEIIRSARRQKSVSARLQGDTLIVQAPENIGEQELAAVIEKLKGRIERKQVAQALTDDDLEKRASALNRRYFEGKLRWKSVRWVTNQRTVNGSCTPSQGTIRISHRLAETPTWVLDYVLVHELAHLREANHGPRFWKLVNRYHLTERARGYLMALGLEESEAEASPT